MEDSKENYDALVENETIKEEVREEYEQLRLSIEKLNHKIASLFSYYQTFVRGVIQGVGIAIGSGVVFVILSALLYQLFSYLGVGSGISNFIPVKNLPNSFQTEESR